MSTDAYESRSPRGTRPRPRFLFPLWLWGLIALVPLAAFMTDVGRSIHATTSSVETKAHAESTYLSKSEYALQRQRDSGSIYSEVHDMRSVVFGLDSSDRCRRGYRNYCR